MSVNERKYDFPLCLIRDDHGRICGREASYFDLDRGAWVCAAHGAHAASGDKSELRLNESDSEAETTWILRFGA
jgi:hypothetical protein